MAIKRSITSPHDGSTLSACHHKISSVDWSVERDSIQVAVKSYASKADANAGRDFIMKRIFRGDFATVFATNGNPINRIYDWLKTLPEFSGAEDD